MIEARFLTHYKNHYLKELADLIVSKVDAIIVVNHVKQTEYDNLRKSLTPTQKIQLLQSEKCLHIFDICIYLAFLTIRMILKLMF